MPEDHVPPGYGSVPHYIGDRGHRGPRPGDADEARQEADALYANAGCLSALLITLAVLTGLIMMVAGCLGMFQTGGPNGLWLIFFLIGSVLHFLLFLLLAFYLRGLARCTAWLVRQRLAEKQNPASNRPSDDTPT